MLPPITFHRAATLAVALALGWPVPLHPARSVVGGGPSSGGERDLFGTAVARAPGESTARRPAERADVPGAIEPHCAKPSPAAPERPQTSVPDLAPELELPDLSGASQRLSGLRGRIVVLSFLSMSCERCRERLPSLVEIQSDFARWGVQVIGVFTDGSAEPGEVVAFARRHRVNFPLWVGATRADIARFGFGSLVPETVVIDAGGRTVARFASPVRKGALRKAVEALVPERRAGCSPRRPPAARQISGGVAGFAIRRCTRGPRRLAPAVSALGAAGGGGRARAGTRFPPVAGS